VNMKDKSLALALGSYTYNQIEIQIRKIDKNFFEYNSFLFVC